MALFTAKPGGLNFTGYRNAEVDELLVEARSMTDRIAARSSMTACRRSSECRTALLFPLRPLRAAHRAGAVQGIKPALNGIMYNFDRWWVPKDLQRYHVRP